MIEKGQFSYSKLCEIFKNFFSAAQFK